MKYYLSYFIQLKFFNVMMHSFYQESVLLFVVHKLRTMTPNSSDTRAHIAHSVRFHLLDVIKHRRKQSRRSNSINVTITNLDFFILSFAAIQKFTKSERSGGQDVLAGHVFIDRISTVWCFVLLFNFSVVHS
jgi:hypothetical protein